LEGGHHFDNPVYALGNSSIRSDSFNSKLNNTHIKNNLNGTMKENNLNKGKSWSMDDDDSLTYGGKINAF